MMNLHDGNWSLNLNISGLKWIFRIPSWDDLQNISKNAVGGSGWVKTFPNLNGLEKSEPRSIRFLPKLVVARHYFHWLLKAEGMNRKKPVGEVLYLYKDHFGE